MEEQPPSLSMSWTIVHHNNHRKLFIQPALFWLLNSCFIILHLTFVILELVRFANVFDLGTACTCFVLAILHSLFQGLWLIIILLFWVYDLCVYRVSLFLSFLCFPFSSFIKPTSDASPRNMLCRSLQETNCFVNLWELKCSKNSPEM